MSSWAAVVMGVWVRPTSPGCHQSECPWGFFLRPRGFQATDIEGTSRWHSLPTYKRPENLEMLSWSHHVSDKRGVFEHFFFRKTDCNSTKWSSMAPMHPESAQGAGQRASSQCYTSDKCRGHVLRVSGVGMDTLSGVPARKRKLSIQR